MKTRLSLTPSHYLFSAALLIRLLVLARLAASPSLLPSSGDMHFYDAWAQRIVHGGTGPALAFYGLPGYAYFLAGFYSLFGYGPFLPALFQACLEAATAVLIFLLTRRVLDFFPSPIPADAASSGWRAIATQPREIAAFLAGLAWVFFVPAEAYAVILMPTSLAVFVFWGVVWLLVRKANPPSSVAGLGLGLILGITATAVATVVFLLPLAAASLFRKANGARRDPLKIGAGLCVLLLGVVLGSAPCWVHNYFVARDPVMFSAHSGINFWIGNNPEANGYPRFPPGLHAGQAAMLQDSINTAEAAAGHPLKRAEVSAFWTNKATHYIRNHFAGWFRLELVKLRNMLSAFQYDDLSVITPLRDQHVVFPGLYFGLVAALSIPGMLLVWRAPTARWIMFAMLLHVAALLPVFVTERYRIPLVPGLLVFATAGIVRLAEACLLVDLSTVARYAFALVVTTLVVSSAPATPALWALDAYNTGREALESNDLKSAERNLLLARAYVPENAETNFAMGNLRLAQGDPEAAAGFYRIVLSLDPSHTGALNNLGVLALDRNDLDGARSYFEVALARDPRNAKAHFLLAKTALAAGDPASARRELARALEITPEQPEFRDLQRKLGDNAGPP